MREMPKDFPTTFGPCHVSVIPLQKGKIPFAKEKKRAPWLERGGDFPLKGRKFPLT
jgi:hypothetical protein